MTPKRPRMHSQRSTALVWKNYLWIFIFTLTTVTREKNPFAEFCHLRDQDYCKILKFHSVRWLAMTICIERMIKLFLSLQNYCLSLKTQYTKYARIRVFTDPYAPVQGQNLRFYPYTGEYGSVKSCILACFMQ